MSDGIMPPMTMKLFFAMKIESNGGMVPMSMQPKLLSLSVIVESAIPDFGNHPPAPQYLSKNIPQCVSQYFSTNISNIPQIFPAALR